MTSASPTAGRGEVRPPPDSATPVTDNRSPGRWHHFEHDADIGLVGTAPTLAGAFEAIATALTAVVADPESVEPREALTIQCEAADAELLLYDWLNALIYEMAVRGWLFGVFSVELEGRRLRARVWGEPVERRRHGPAVEIKGATWTELSLSHADGGWTATCVVDV